MDIALPGYFSSGVSAPLLPATLPHHTTPYTESFVQFSCSVQGCNPKVGSLLGIMIFNLQSMWFPLFEHMALQLPRTCQFLGNSCQMSELS